MKTTWLMTLALAAGLAAQPPEGRGPGRHRFGAGAPPEGEARVMNYTALKETLALSDDQVDKLRQLQKSQRTALAPLAKQMGEKQRALHQAMRDGSTAESGKAALAEIETLRKQMSTARAANRTQAVALLNPAQKQKLQALQDAAKLMRSVHEAAMLDLVEAPAGGPAGGPGPMMMRRGR
jgi:LTXXQ motif family protein